MKISIITICYNAEKEIENTIRSTLDQTYKDFEYIIVDGASQDKTIEVVFRVLKEYDASNVKVISEPDKGIYDAMNKGIRIATGEWLSMMNAGDMFADCHVLENIFKKPISDKISFIYSDFYKATSFGKYFKVDTCCNEKRRLLVHQSTIYRRNLHNEHGLYIVTSELTVSDYMFFMRIPLDETMKVDTVIAKYEGGGISEYGGWCRQCGICTDVVFRKSNFWLVQLNYIKWRMKTLLPKKVRERIRIKLSGVGNV